MTTAAEEYDAITEYLCANMRYYCIHQNKTMYTLDHRYNRGCFYLLTDKNQVDGCKLVYRVGVKRMMRILDAVAAELDRLKEEATP